jgi:exopolyphosphatase
MNCNKIDLPLKTEVTHYLKQHQINLNNVICKDELDLQKNVENFVLVDHHVSPYHDKVISVLDHRPYDENSNLNEECAVNIQEVGSCSTVVAEAIKNDVGLAGLKDFKEILRLLYGPIVLDTINFAKDADKVRELDFEMASVIEGILEIDDISATRKTIYEELVAARADVSSLDSLQILSKDLKIISNSNSTYRVAFPGVLVFEYIQMKNAEENVRKFAQREKIDVVMLMGMKPKGNTIERHLGVININSDKTKLYNDILEAVKNMNNPALNLILQKDLNFMNGEFFIQENIKASRKQILPVIKELLESY